jgi:hypothetical protein
LVLLHQGKRTDKYKRNVIWKDTLPLAATPGKVVLHLVPMKIGIKAKEHATELLQ